MSSVARASHQVSERGEVVWTLLSPAGRVLVCGLYSIGTTFEVRVGFRNEPALRTQWVATERAGAFAAGMLKMIALSNGFLEATTHVKPEGGLQ
jgi:hypothetical protein